MNQMGQFWSLDIVLAAAVFTLALGLVVSQSELGLFYSVQEKNQHLLQAMTILGSNNLASQADFILDKYPAVCVENPSFCSGAPVCNSSGLPCSLGQSPIYVLNGQINVKCGPNFDYVLVGAGNIGPKFKGWLADRELSGLENCIVNSDSPLRQHILGIPVEYNVDLSATMLNGNPLQWYTAKPIITDSFIGINRRLLVFPDHPLAGDLRNCMDGLCPEYLTDVNFRVWWAV